MHRCIYTSAKNANPNIVDGKFVTSDYIGLTKYYIFQELFTIKQEHSGKFGDMVVCLDNSSGGYWRKDVFPDYKSNRAGSKEESQINFNEVFLHINELTDQIAKNLPWKVVSVKRAEADDIILVLAKEFHKYENILIHSPDKDMIQAQRNNETVFQWSALTKKWIKPENKHDDMDDWVQEHVCLGDASDGVPKIVDHTEFTDIFKSYLEHNGITVETPLDFRNSSLPKEQKINLIENFDVYKTNRKGENTNVKDIYKSVRFGASNLKKAIKEHGGIDNWLDSHPQYREHYNRNFALVMEEGIPSNIWNEIIVSFKEAETVYRDKEFENYLIENNLKSILMDLPTHFKITRDLTADDFGW